VNRALRERLLAQGIGIVRAWHVNNTLFLNFSRSVRARLPVALALRAYLFVERLRFRALKLALKGLFEALGVVYVPEKLARQPV